MNVSRIEVTVCIKGGGGLESVINIPWNGNG